MTATLFDREEPAEMKITALAPWKGSNRMLAKHVSEALRGCEWVGIPFAGGMAEVPHIGARTILVNDIHQMMMNLARITACTEYGPKLYRELRRQPFHPKTLEEYRELAKTWDGIMEHNTSERTMKSLEGAIAYFVCVWMNRSACAGTDAEYRGNLPIRWNAGGGDSAKRYQSAVCSLNAWRRTLQRCTFSVMDFRDFLAKCLNHDKPLHGIYSDSPFPDAGDDYRHKFTEKDQRELAKLLVSFKQAKVVARFYDHPLIRELYPESDWKWNFLTGRDQANGDKPEVLLTRN